MVNAAGGNHVAGSDTNYGVFITSAWPTSTDLGGGEYIQAPWYWCNEIQNGGDVNNDGNGLGHAPGDTVYFIAMLT